MRYVLAIWMIGFSSMSSGTEPQSSVRFSEVVPVLTKLGCNSGGCHGKATGQNGFKLSLLGFDPDWDHRALVKEARGRRIFINDPDRSLLLLKATNKMPHGGGQRLHIEKEEYRILREWIRQGAKPPDECDPVLQRIQVSHEASHHFAARKASSLGDCAATVADDSRLQLTVTAYFDDGSARDVTQQSLYESNAPNIAKVTEDGVITVDSKESGLFAVMVRYAGQITTFHGILPKELDASSRKRIDSMLSKVEQEIGESRFDHFLWKQWKQLRIAPADLADDETFLRRAMIDICGTLPTRQEVEAYVQDSQPDKRHRLIDRLLERPEYADYFALKWADILQNRGAGYSTSKQRAGTSLFAGWIRDSIAANKPYDQFVADILTASGSQKDNPPAIWHRSVRTLPNYVESVSQAFLGVRIQCAQCHHHPFERWSQSDYYGLAAVFARVGRKGGFADAEVPTNETIYLKDQGQVFHPRTGELISPRPLGGPDLQLERYDDPRVHLANWMIDRENPFFARTMVNRLWAHFLGRGIIHPIDDARSTNPPSNPELLASLTEDFIHSGYNVKHLIRVICNSYAYRLSSIPHEWNHEDTQSFARFYPRRLPAEVLLDGISQVLESPTPFAGGPGKFPSGMRAIQLPDENIPTNFLTVFGRPARFSACECERIDAPSLAQAMELINSQEIQRKLTDKNGYVTKLMSNTKSITANVNDIIVRVFGRSPTAAEVKTAVDFLKNEKDQTQAYRSLLWSLLATNEFMFNR